MAFGFGSAIGALGKGMLGGGGSGQGVGGTLAQLRQKMLESGMTPGPADPNQATDQGGWGNGQGWRSVGNPGNPGTRSQLGQLPPDALSRMGMSPAIQADIEAGRVGHALDGSSSTTSPGMMGPNGPIIPPGPNQSPFPSQQPQQGAVPTGPGTLNVNPASVGTTPQNISDSPAYQFRFGEGNRAGQQSAAARGSLLTGGTLKDLQDRGQGLASTEFGNQWNRDFQLAGLNSGIAEGNAGRQLGGLTSLMGTGYNAAAGQGATDIYAGNAQAGGTVDAQSAVNQGVGAAANTIGAYLAARKLRQQQQGQSGTGAGMWAGPTNPNGPVPA